MIGPACAGQIPIRGRKSFAAPLNFRGGSAVSVSVYARKMHKRGAADDIRPVARLELNVRDQPKVLDRVLCRRRLVM